MRVAELDTVSMPGGDGPAAAASITYALSTVGGTSGLVDTATYDSYRKAGFTLVYGKVRLDAFRTSALSSTWLAQLERSANGRHYWMAFYHHGTYMGRQDASGFHQPARQGRGRRPRPAARSLPLPLAG